MAFNEIRKLRSAERELHRRIAEASAQLANGHQPDFLERAFIAGRPPRHPLWALFMRFASPINEAAEHIADHRRKYESEVEDAISDTIRKIRRAKP